MSDDTATSPGDNGAELPGYADSLDELQSILATLESNTADVDLLADRVQRADLLIRHCRSRLDDARFRVEQVRAFADAVDGLRATIGDRARTAVDRADDRLDSMVRQTTAVATAVLNRHDDRLTNLISRIQHGPLTSLDHQAERLDAVAARVRGLDPARILTRGWSITRRGDGTLVRSTDDVSIDDQLFTTLEGGEVTSTVNSVTDGNRNAP